MKLKNLVRAAVFAAFVFVATTFFKIPLPVTGYVHLGDAAIFLACVFLPFPYDAAAAAIGSALADILGGYVSYAPVTLVIKFVMPCIFRMIMKGKKWQFVLGAILATIWMSVGYAAYDWVLYGVQVAALNLLSYMLKGCIATVIAFVVAYATKKFWQGEREQTMVRKNRIQNKKHQ